MELLDCALIRGPPESRGPSPFRRFTCRLYRGGGCTCASRLLEEPRDDQAALAFEFRFADQQAGADHVSFTPWWRPSMFVIVPEKSVQRMPLYWPLPSWHQ